MKRKQLSLLIAGVVTATTIASPFTGRVSIANASTITTPIIQSVENENQIILTDLPTEKGSYTKWRSINKNLNSDGKPIKLRVFGEATEFTNGVGAHAESSIIYKVEEHTNKYTRLRGYAGIDFSMGARGDGATISIQVSENGEDWETKFKTGTVKGDGEAVILDVDVTGAKFVRLFADKNGYNGSDHVVYGDLKLVDPSNEAKNGSIMKGIKKVAEYDAELKAKGEPTKVAETSSQLVYQREFVKRVGYEAFNNLYSMKAEYRKGMEFLFHSKEAIAYFIEAGEFNASESPTQAILNFAKIYAKHGEEINKDRGFTLKLAVSVALSHSSPVAFWMGNAKPHDPVQRFDSFRLLISSGLMEQGKEGNVEEFKNLPVALMKFTTNTRLHEDEVIWLAEHALKMKESGKDHLNAYNYIRYTGGYNYNEEQYYDKNKKAEWDAKYDLSHFDDYGTPGVVRNFMIFEEGAVCGGLAKTYATTNEVFGKPAQVVHQPGHGATICYDVDENGKAIWVIRNDIFGWGQSRDEMGQMPLTWGMQSWNSNRSASYVVLAQRNLDEYEDYAKALRLNIMADVYKEDKAKAEDIYRKALEVQPRQLDSMVGLINTFKGNQGKKSENYVDLARQIVENFKHYPLAMVDLMRLIEGNVGVADKPEFDLLKANALIEATTLTDEDVHQSGIAKQVANHILGTEKKDLATFSFDGDNANQIVINPDYSESGIRVRYSLDGGKTYEQTNEHVIDLSSKLSKINATNDIYVGLVGTNDVFKIDIKDTKAPELVAHDLENKLIGNINNLEISLDKGQKWCNYTSDMKLEGESIIYARYKANGTNLQSAHKEYRFTQEEVDKKRSYVSIDSLSLKAYSSQQNGGDQSAKNMIDGNDNTRWHTKWNTTDKGRFYTVELDEVKYITSIEYLPALGGGNGRLKDVEIWTSMTGEDGDWVLSGSETGLPNNEQLKTIDLDEPTPTRFVKIVGKSTHGNNTGEQNKYFSGRTFNFYEDKTLTYVEATPKVEEKVEEKSVETTKKEETKEVEWISTRTELEDGITVMFDSINTIKLSNPVKAFIVYGDNMELLDITKPEHTFTKNGTFTFRLRNKQTKEIKEIPVKVDWILEKQ